MRTCAASGSAAGIVITAARVSRFLAAFLSLPFCFAVIVLALPATCLRSTAQAGTLSPTLRATLEKSSGPVTALVSLSEQAPVAALRSGWKTRGAGRAERHREVVRALQEAAARSQRPLLAWLEEEQRAGRVISFKAYWISNLIVVKAAPAELAAIAARPDVDLIEPDFHPVLVAPAGGPPDAPRRSPAASGASVGRGIPDGIRAIRAPEVWRELGITGAGRIVANLDTGVDGGHPALQTRWRGFEGRHPARACWFDTAGLDTIPRDGHGHGTLVMGVITGIGPDTGDTTGVAWGAEWIACNAIAPGNHDAGADIIVDAYQWFADPDGDPETVDDVPDVVQNSWGNSPDEEGYRECDPHWWAAIDNCEAAGAVTVWSAGNSGPGGGTIIVPADRATSDVNTFSVGAVDATDASWPYIAAPFSSRGPSFCPGPDNSRIKPEVTAPGVDVRSTAAGGGYGGASGTSLSGPHVAGIVALMREANPDLDGETIKRILMETARDLGPAGEDNTYGWGFVDAHAAVVRALTGYGSLEGTVVNGSLEERVLPGAAVRLLGTNYLFPCKGPRGAFRGTAGPGSYVAVAEREGFSPESASVTITAARLARCDFSLRDIAGPVITMLDRPGFTTDTLASTPIRFIALDASGVVSVTARSRRGEDAWSSASASCAGDTCVALLPAAPPDTRIEYVIEAVDGTGQRSLWPAAGTADSLLVRRLIAREDFETIPAAGWSTKAPGDDASSGTWVQAVPVGTESDGTVMQPASDHTADPGSVCFVTGNGLDGEGAGDHDVDNGCTTLTSPDYALEGAKNVFVSYWRWFALGGASKDDTLRVDVSSDGGVSWVRLERVPEGEPAWREVSADLSRLVPGAERVRFRFRACDLGGQGVVEAALDDFSLSTYTPAEKRYFPGGALGLIVAPNPTRGGIGLRFRLPAPAQVTALVTDAAGREVRRLGPLALEAGEGKIVWDLRNSAGRRVASGRYFCRVAADALEQTAAVTVLR